MNSGEIKALWKEHGGSQHGPIVEHYTIEEQAFYRFAQALRDRVREECAHPHPSAGDAEALRDNLKSVRTALFNLGVSHNTFTTVLDDGGGPTMPGSMRRHQLRAPLGREAVQFALESENAAHDALKKLDDALADLGGAR